MGRNEQPTPWTNAVISACAVCAVAVHLGLTQSVIWSRSNKVGELVQDNARPRASMQISAKHVVLVSIYYGLKCYGEQTGHPDCCQRKETGSI